MAVLRLVLCLAVAAAWVPDNSTALPHLHNSTALPHETLGVAAGAADAAASAVPKQVAGVSLGSALVLAFRLIAGAPAAAAFPAPGGVVAAAPVAPAAGAGAAMQGTPVRLRAARGVRW